MNKLNILKRILITIIILAIFVGVIIIGSCVGKAESLTIEEYEDAIRANNEKIEQCEEIKKQLNITAELIRKQEFHDVDFVNSLSAKWVAQDNYQNTLRNANIKLKITLGNLRSSEASQETIVETQQTATNVTSQVTEVHEYIGDFKITHYCICKKCCGKSPSHPYYGITATGTIATPGRTIAVDPRKIPYGTKVIIEGHTYIAEDCGGAIKGNKIDICVASHSEALQKGVKNNVPVYIVRG